MKICAIIPAHNESENIGLLVEKLKRKGLDVVVIDDGSSDGSGSIAREKGAHVIIHEQKKGKGNSLREGFEYALNQNSDGVITLDGDGQHDVDDIDMFIEKTKQNPVCVINGTRMDNPKGMPLLRLLVNRVMSSMITTVCKQKIPDTQCGYRFIHIDILRLLKLSSSDFEIESEVLIQSSRNGAKIYSVPIKTIYCNESSKINPQVS